MSETKGFPKPAWLCGIELDRASPAFGEVVCPLVFLWRMRGQRRTRILGRLPHGTAIKVLMSRVGGDERTYYYVSAWGKVGWVSSPFVSWVDPATLTMENLPELERASSLN